MADLPVAEAAMVALPAEEVATAAQAVAAEDMEDPVVAEAVNALMGSKPELRFRFIQEHAAFAKDLDI